MKKVLVVGSLNMDFVVNVDTIPIPGETILGNKMTLIPGGKGANQAYAMGKLGAATCMIGAVGNDKNKDMLLENLNSVKINTNSIEIIEDENTGIAFINVDKKGENCIVVIQGANKLVDRNIIDKNINLIEEADIIVMQLEIPVDTIEYVAKIAKEKGKTVILDPAPARNDLPEELFANVDIIKPNETELEILSGMKIKDEQDIIKASNLLLKKGVGAVIVTVGRKGSILVKEDKYKKFTPLDVEVIDTTAAGDSFIGGMVASLLNDKSLEEAIEYGHIVSSIVVTKKGAQSSIPSIDEVKFFLDKYMKGRNG